MKDIKRLPWDSIVVDNSFTILWAVEKQEGDEKDQLDLRIIVVRTLSSVDT